MGIASLIIATIAIIALVALSIVVRVLVGSEIEGFNPQNPQSIQDSPEFVILGLAGLGVIVSLVANLVGLGLGIAGLVQGSRKRLFAILGTILNPLVILVFLFAGPLIGGA